jgi:hypothetical protein
MCRLPLPALSRFVRQKGDMLRLKENESGGEGVSRTHHCSPILAHLQHRPSHCDLRLGDRVESIPALGPAPGFDAFHDALQPPQVRHG